MSAYTAIRTVAEIVADHSNSSWATKRVSAYLKAGWILLDVHERGYDHTREGESARYFTVYILGNTDPEAQDPTRPKDASNDDIKF